MFTFELQQNAKATNSSQNSDQWFWGKCFIINIVVGLKWMGESSEGLNPTGRNMGSYCMLRMGEVVFHKDKHTNW